MKSIQSHSFVLAGLLVVTGTACDAGESSEENTSAPGASETTSAASTGEDTAGSGGEGSTGDDPSDGVTGNPTTDPSDPTGDPTTDDTSDTGIDVDPQNVIDDLEDGDALILAANGRRGAWYTYNDESKGATQVPGADEAFAPVDGGPADSIFMAHTDGSGFAVWGAGLGVDLNNEGDDEGGPGIRNPYDASAFSGVVFFARGNAPVRVKFLVDAVVPVESGGSCDSPTDCEDAHGKIVPLTADWQQFQVGFDELFQEGWGIAADFDAGTLMSIQFQVPANTDFEFDLDDLAFY
ncbi:MAG: hypothetical protein ACRBN8_32845 [Nannocystales bacterium]